jgi:hypothetical protein
MFSDSQIAEWRDTGGLLVRGLFSASEVMSLAGHFEAIRQKFVESSTKPLRDEEYEEGDPLIEYQRILQPHHRDEVALNWLLDQRLKECMTHFLGMTPYAVQTMFYFKPPQSRGQALHQDQFYLRVKPGTCLAAWMAIDPSDEENGCLQIVPGSHDWPLLCTREADPKTSFTDIEVEIPEGATTKSIIMNLGDVFFFNGWLVHGSHPNTSLDRFRRTMIGHYIVGEAEECFEWYNPIYTFDRENIHIKDAPAGGKCGVWIDREGVPQLEMQPEVRINKM